MLNATIKYGTSYISEDMVWKSLPGAVNAGL